jgi:molybdate/tungstate transport system substrate-binding protein
METGEADAVIAYKHEAIERGFPFISLPPQINLADPSQVITSKPVVHNYTES